MILNFSRSRSRIYFKDSHQSLCSVSTPSHETVNRKREVSIKALKKTIIFLSTVLFLFILLEAGLRFFDYGYSTSYVLRKQTATGDKVVLNPCALLPYSGLSVINSSREVFLNMPVDKPAGGIRVLVLGGSAAYGAYFAPELSFARYLEAMLKLQYTERKIEVVSLSFPSLNTGSMKRILKDALFLKPDAVVCYEAGNDLGRGVVMEIGPLPPALMLAAEETLYTLKRLKIYQLAVDYAGRYIRRLIEELVKQDDYNEFKSFQSMTPQVVESLTGAYRHNIKKITAICRKNHVPVFLCTYAHNMKNLCSDDPFADSTGLREILANLPLLYQAYAHERAGDYETAIFYYERFNTFFPQLADSLCHLAFCYQALGRPDKAAEVYDRACSLSAGHSKGLNFLNQELRDIAAASQKGNVLLIDVAAALQKASPLGYLPDEAFFTDLVHFTSGGSYQTAAEIFRSITPLFTNEPAVEPPSQAECERRMGVTFSQEKELMVSNSHETFAGLTDLLGRPPMSYALMHDVTKAYRLKLFTENVPLFGHPDDGGLLRNHTVPDDPDYYYHKNQIAELNMAGKRKAALAVAERLVGATGRHSLSLILYGQTLLSDSQPGKAFTLLREALTQPARFFDLGLRMKTAQVALASGRIEEAVDILEKGWRIIENNAPVIDFNKRTFAGLEQRYLSTLAQARQQLSATTGQKNERHQK